MKDYTKENALKIFATPIFSLKEAFISTHANPDYVISKDATFGEVNLATSKYIHNATNVAMDLLENESKKGYKIFYPYDDSRLGLYYLKSQASQIKGNVILLPGGGYAMESTYGEGFRMASELLPLGYNCFVVMYRTGPEAAFPNVLVDFRKAMDVIFDKDNNFNVDDNAILMGFSAGGHLASTVSRKDISLAYGLPRFKYLVLGYPVITFKEGTHGGTRETFLGKYKDNETFKEFFSNEDHVDKDYPTTFMMRSEKDPAVPDVNSALFSKALSDNNVPYMFKIYPGFGHGWDTGIGTPSYGWINEALNFFEKNPR